MRSPKTSKKINLLCLKFRLNGFLCESSPIRFARTLILCSVRFIPSLELQILFGHNVIVVTVVKSSAWGHSKSSFNR